MSLHISSKQLWNKLTCILLQNKKSAAGHYWLRFRHFWWWYGGWISVLFKWHTWKSKPYNRNSLYKTLLKVHRRLNWPVNGPLVRFKLGLWVKRHTDRGISCCRGCWDMDLCGLGVLLSVARHLRRHKPMYRVTFWLFCHWFYSRTGSS